MAAAVRLFRLGGQSLWIDELFTLRSAGLFDGFSWRDLLDNVHGPLFSLALRGTAALAGRSEWAMRLPSAIAGILTVPAMAWLARRWLGPRAAAPAAWLAAGSPFLVWYSQECRGYAFLMLFTCLACASVLALHERAGAGRVTRALAASAGALLSNLSFALALPVLARWTLAAGPTRRARLRALALACAALAIVALPWLPAIARLWDWSRLEPARAVPAGELPLRGTTTFHAAAVPFALHAFAVGFTAGPSLRELRHDPSFRPLARHAPELAGATIVFGALGALGLAALARRRRLLDAALWLVAPAVAVSYFAVQNFKVFHPRYLAVSMPCVLLVLAAAFADAGPRTRRVLGLGVAALWAVSLAHNAFDPAYQREDYRGALAHVRAAISPGERVLAAGAPEPVQFYGRGLDVEPWWLGHAARPARMEETLRAALAGSRGAWVVLSRSEDLDPGDRFARWLDARVPPSSRFATGGVRVWHLTSETMASPAPAPSAPGSRP